LPVTDIISELKGATGGVTRNLSESPVGSMFGRPGPGRFLTRGYI
jgi:hypothetical protein